MSKKTPKLPSFIKDDPYLQTIISKMADKKEEDRNKKPISLLAGGMDKVTDSVKEKIKNNEDIVQLFPDIELSIQILTSSILSPNDMMIPSLQYVTPEIELPLDVKAILTDTIKTHMNKHYSLEDKMAVILRESMFTKGAYIEAILPDITLGKIMNDMDGELSIESFMKGLDVNTKGFLGATEDKYKLSTEDIYPNEDKLTNKVLEVSSEDLGINVTDNIDFLLSTEAYKRDIPNRVKKVLEDTTISTEDFTVLQKTFGKNNNDSTGKDVVALELPDDIDADSKGRPVILKLPVESVIPVYASTDVSNHLGYFVLLDSKGVPINMNSSSFVSSEIMQQSINNNSHKTNIIAKAKKSLIGITKKDPVVNNVEKVYFDIITTVIKDKLSKGLYGDVVAIKENTDLYRVMLHKTLEGDKTRLLYIPQELVAFYAFDYRDNGTGKSLLEKVSMLFSIRSILMFSSLMANLKNSVTTTEVSVELDENDPDPEATKELIMSETLKTRQTQLPLGVMKVDDLVEWSHKVGFKYNFKHPSLPDINIDVNDTNTNKVVPDTEIDERIQEQIIMSFGLTKEMVSSGYDPEFATTVVSNNILLAKRVTQHQIKFTGMMSKHIRKIMKNDITLRNKILEIVDNNMTAIKKYVGKNQNEENIDIKKVLSNNKLVSEYILQEFTNHIAVTLPKPELTEATNLKTAYEDHIEHIDGVLENLISSDALPEELIGSVADNLVSIRSIMKTISIKKWMTDNNYMPEISKFLTLDNDGNPIINLLDEYDSFAEILTKTLLPFLKKNKKFTNKVTKEIDKLDEEEDDTTDTDDTTEENTGEDNTGDNTDDVSNDATEDDTTEDNPDDEIDVDKL